MKTYEKGNQVYTAQECSMLELELIARGFKEVVEKETDINKMKLDELKSYAENEGIIIPEDIKKKEDVLAFIKEQQQRGE
ncbi:hypothetical protein KP763_03785 [Streptococcus equi subsp. equi]|uniref:hypothetical protein n=1 Tax=Streptococcus equi TaxID=1336 RepID=UPI0013AAD300|nr:hypothetical protein [Streptococcus equi]MCD3473166.1 hypothetical protein [Streptococcus equi subsp. equi]MCD3514858.1 hypothetical protein [Streptococcus equi subsp. equi]MCD3540966.1 hypothetical protein [Streptococcus equi subsp. equi]MCD3545267.1 hypothetical protein [Streptococcus equi subsp. equi]NBL35355.1 hypothetical protein [Streptococcus equi]